MSLRDWLLEAVDAIGMGLCVIACIAEELVRRAS